ncbi:MAG TPA: sialidase family protein [Vicinamibacterales bacterium]|nr:sialidase family protein [Vicinamibacterales bacterium]
MSTLLALALASTLAVPGRSNATPSIAAEGTFVAVTWSASLPTGATDVFAAVSRDAGRSFGAPVRVNDVDGDARVNGEQPPRVALVARRGAAAPSILVVWTTKGANGTRIVEARSDDGGRTFGKAAAVPGGDAAGNRGWEAIVASRGVVDAVWLDHRAMAAHTHDGHMSPEQSSLYFAAADGSVSPHALTNGVCYCCKTAIAAGADGALYTAWRQVYAGNVRDIAFTMSRDGGRSFAAPLRVSEDNWILDGCPDDGPAIAVDGRSRIHIVWPTLVKEGDGEPTIALFYATSPDGKRFSPRLRLPTEGLPHHPQIALRADGSAVVAWDEVKDGKRRAVLASEKGAQGGGAAFTREPLADAAPALYPIAAVADGGVVVAWTSGAPAASTIAVRVIK